MDYRGIFILELHARSYLKLRHRDVLVINGVFLCADDGPPADVCRRSLRLRAHHKRQGKGVPAKLPRPCNSNNLCEGKLMEAMCAGDAPE